MLYEIWRPVVGYEKYEVSNMGRIRSLNYNKTGQIKVLSSRINKRNGYVQIVLCEYGIPKTFKIHRLVAQAFPEICGKWFEGCEINHKNEDKTDNRAVNLEVCTKSYNTTYGTRIIRQTEKVSKKVGQFYLDGITLKSVYTNAYEIERTTGYKQPAIQRCCIGKQKTAYGYIWRYI